MFVDSFPDRTVIIEETEYLYFGGTSYLGLATHKAFKKLLAESIEKWGSFYGSSRQSNIKLSIFEKAEALFAKQVDAESALTTSSGTLAGKLVLEFLSKTDYSFYHYPKTHPAIIAPNSIPLFVDGALHENLQNNKREQIVITADAILALEVLPTSFNFLSRISASKDITLIVDESHSLGILGVQGHGIYSSISSQYLKRKILISSLGKALALHGGLIASDRQFIANLKKETLFVSSSCANANYLETYSNAEAVISNQKDILKYNLEFFSKRFKPKKGFKFDENYPVIYSDDQTIYNTLLEQNIIISNFKYPNYDGDMNRIVITANHTQADLQKLLDALNT